MNGDCDNASESMDEAEKYPEEREAIAETTAEATTGTMKFVRLGCTRLIAERDEHDAEGKHQRLSIVSDSWRLRHVNTERVGERELTALINFLISVRDDIVTRK